MESVGEKRGVPVLNLLEIILQLKSHLWRGYTTGSTGSSKNFKPQKSVHLLANCLLNYQLVLKIIVLLFTPIFFKNQPYTSMCYLIFCQYSESCS